MGTKRTCRVVRRCRRLLQVYNFLSTTTIRCQRGSRSERRTTIQQTTMGKIVWPEEQKTSSSQQAVVVNLSNPKTWATTNATGPSTLTSLPTSRNPNFAPRQSWPEEKYNIKYPSNWQPGKHRFETFKDKRGSDFGDKTKPKPKRKNSPS